MTRKLSGILLLLLSAILLCACGNTADAVSYTDFISGARMEWTFGGVTYTGTVNLTGDDTDDTSYRSATVTVESPEDVAGIVVTYGNEGVSASVGQVSFTLPEHTGEEIYALVRLLSFTDSDVTDKRGNTLSFSENTPAGALTATLTVDKEGYPTEGVAVLDDTEIQVRFIEFFRRETEDDKIIEQLNEHERENPKYVYEYEYDEYGNVIREDRYVNTFTTDENGEVVPSGRYKAYSFEYKWEKVEK